MNEINIIRTKIQALLDSENISNYAIFKATGISQGYLSDLKKGNKSIDNMKLSTVERFIEYYEKLKKD